MTIRRLFLLFIVILLLLSFGLSLKFSGNLVLAQETNNKKTLAKVASLANVDKNEITIGDKIKYEILIRYRGDVNIQFPELEQIGVFTVKKTGGIKEPEREKDDYFVIKRYYVLTTYEIGRQTIPHLKIKYKDAHGENEVTTNEIIIDVKGVMKEGETASDIKDIVPPMGISTNFTRLIMWIAAGLGTLLIGGSIYWLIGKRKKQKEEQKFEYIYRTPHEIAYEMLENLLKEDLLAKGLAKEYYYRINDILRHYIENRFSLLAPERTTEEFLEEMAHTDKLEDNHKVLVQEFLEHCDMVKYAKYKPSRIEAKETYDLVKRLIDETRQILEEKEVIVKR